MKAFLFLYLSTLIAIIGGAPTLGPYIRFLKRLLFGPSDLKYSNIIIFDENHGEVNRGHFENAYGHQGHILIAAYGLGLPPQKLKMLGYL